MASQRRAILFDIDGALLITGGVGAASWRLALDELYAIPADIATFTDPGMTATPVYGEPVRAAHAFVVGDTPRDVEGAHAAGMACLGVGSHPFTVDHLSGAGTDYAIASLIEGLPLTGGDGQR